MKTEKILQHLGKFQVSDVAYEGNTFPTGIFPLHHDLILPHLLVPKSESLPVFKVHVTYLLQVNLPECGNFLLLGWPFPANTVMLKYHTSPLDAPSQPAVTDT